MSDQERRMGCLVCGSNGNCEHTKARSKENNSGDVLVVQEDVPPGLTQNDIVTRQEHPETALLVAARQKIEIIATASTVPTLLAQGGESLVFDRGETVLKVAKRNDVGYLNVWAENKKLFEIIKKYLGDFIPTTTFYESFTGPGIPEEVSGHAAVEQRKIQGNHLNELNGDEMKNPVLLKRLADLMEAVIKLCQDEDVVIDWYGTQPDTKTGMGVMNSGNVMIENDMPYLVDLQPIPPVSVTKALTSILWFIKKKDLRGYLSYCRDAIHAKFFRALTKRVYATAMPKMVGQIRGQLEIL